MGIWAESFEIEAYDIAIKAEKDGTLDITETIDVRFLEESQEGFIDIKDKNLISNIIQEIVEIKEYLNLGMEVLITGETTIIEGQECYEVSLGTNSEDSFVREMHYAVNILTWQVYRFDILNDKWEIIGLG